MNTLRNFPVPFTITSRVDRKFVISFCTVRLTLIILCPQVKTSQDVDPPPGDTQEDSAPDSTQEDTPKLKAPLPPVGDTHTPPPTQQG